jgi:glycine dehydrogenase subunit 1
MQYLPLTPQDEREILEKIGVSSFKELLNEIVPPDLQYSGACGLPPAVSEHEVRLLLGEMASSNRSCAECISFLGGGIYDHYIPAIVDSIISRSEFYTAYTPYQAEVSQGTLQTIFEYQSVICELTGMDVSNASMYDAGSALAEACHMASAVTKRKKIICADLIHPYYQRIMHTYTRECGLNIIPCPSDNGALDIARLEALVDSDTACVCVQNPNFWGFLEDMVEIEKRVHKHGALFIAVIDPMSLGVVMPPGEYNADIAVGEGQAMGIAQGFGGPLLGIFTAKKDYVRSLPGRIVGETTDIDGKRGYVLTLQTREQHIRREKATSNICTNEALCALSSLVYLCSLGKQGIIDVGNQCIAKSHYLKQCLQQLPGIELFVDREFFKEFVVETQKPAQAVCDALLQFNIFGGIPLSRFDKNLPNQMLIAVTEKRSREDIDTFVTRLSHVL